MEKQDADMACETEDLGAARQELVRTIAKHAEKGNFIMTAIPGLGLSQREVSTELTGYMHEPSLCLIAQGSKRIVLGEESFSYDADHYLIVSVDLPVVGQILDASPEKPFLGIVLKLDPRRISQLIVDGNLPQPRTQQTSRGMAVSRITLSMLCAFQRLLDLLDHPEDIPILSPLIQHEIVYRLLVGDQGLRLRQMGATGSQSHQLSQAIDWLKNNFNQPLRVEDLAEHARMSLSTFHRHFRELTAMSPLQYQKRLRLHEARRIMFADHLDATTAAFQVGYESSTQFNREYSRLFGAPPLRDIKSLRQKTVNKSVENIGQRLGVGREA